MNPANVDAVVADDYGRAASLSATGDPDDLDSSARGQRDERLLESAVEVALVAGYDRDLLHRAWWQVSRHVEPGDPTSPNGVAAEILARAYAFEPQGTRGQGAAIDAEIYGTRITGSRTANDPVDVAALYVEARARLIAYSTDELHVALQARPLGVIGSNDPRQPTPSPKCCCAKRSTGSSRTAPDPVTPGRYVADGGILKGCRRRLSGAVSIRTTAGD